MNGSSDIVPELKRQPNFYVAETMRLETVEDVEYEEEFALFLDKLIREQSLNKPTSDNNQKIEINKNK